jgi:hypothetical protein
MIEGLVAAAISTLIAGVLLTIMTMNNDGVKNGAVNAKSQSQYEIAIAEIGSYTRSARAVLNNQAGEAYPPGYNLPEVSTSKIMMYDENLLTGAGIITRGFWVDNGQLKEYVPGVGWRPFVVGAWSNLYVLDPTPFRLSNNRRIVTVNMRIRSTFSGDTAVAPARGEVFVCRN